MAGNVSPTDGHLTGGFMPIFIRTAGMWIVAAIGLLAAMPSPAAGV